MTSSDKYGLYYKIVVFFTWYIALYNAIFLLLPRDKKEVFFNKCCLGYSCLTKLCIVTSIIGVSICFLITAGLKSNECAVGVYGACDYELVDSYFGFIIFAETFQIATFITLGIMICKL